MKSTNKNIGQFFKDSLYNYEVKPDGDLWVKIENSNIPKHNVNNYTTIYKIAASVVVIATIAIASYFALPNNDKIINDNHVIKPENQEINKDAISILDSDEKSVDTKNSIAAKEEIKSPQTSLTPIVKIKENITSASDAEIKDEQNKQVVEVKKPIEKSVIESQDPIFVVVSEPNAEDVKKEEQYNIDEEVIAVVVDTFRVKFGDNQNVCFGEDAILEVEDGYFYRWNDGSISNRTIVSPTENSIYIVTVTDGKGNSAIHEYTVNVDRNCSALFIPSAFTPNSDGQNDYFKAEGSGIIKMRMFVFDKLGNKVFETTNIDDSWDGSYKGGIVKSGMFFYHAEYTDALGYDHIKKGQVTVIR